MKKHQYICVLSLVLSAPIVLSGCSTLKSATSSLKGAMTKNSESAEIQAKLEATEKQLMQRDAEIEQLESKVAMANANASGAGSLGGGDLFPPNPEPGHCYARVLTPATYQTTSETVTVREESERVEVIPAQFELVEETVLIKEESSRLEVVPATYETVTEQVMIKPESIRLVEVPARYETVTERVLDKAAHTVWKKGVGPIDGALQTSYDQSTGELMCLVEVPATYKTVTKTVLVEPAKTEEVVIPAEYDIVTKTVLKTPPTTREVKIPAEYGQVTKQKLVSPAQERRIAIPAEYAEVAKREKITEEELAWAEVLCKTNMTPALVSDLQRKLANTGHYGGPIDGVFGSMTIRGVNSYASSKGLTTGSNYITMATAESLGL